LLPSSSESMFLWPI